MSGDLQTHHASVPAQARFGIGARITLLICATVLLASCAIGLVTYWYFDYALVQREFTDLDKLGRSKVDLFVAEVAALGAHAKFLSKIASAQEWARLRAASPSGQIDPIIAAKLRERFSITFSSLLSAHPEYLQIRLISLEDEGTEFARAYRDKDQIRSDLEEDFKGKSHEAYFEPTVRTPPGQVYLSPINLNRENGHVSFPHTPVMRAAVPIRDDQGTVLGFVIVNRLMGPFFAAVSQNLSRKQTLILTNEQGEIFGASRCSEDVRI